MVQVPGGNLIILIYARVWGHYCHLPGETPTAQSYGYINSLVDIATSKQKEVWQWKNRCSDQMSLNNRFLKTQQYLKNPIIVNKRWYSRLQICILTRREHFVISWKIIPKQATFDLYHLINHNVSATTTFLNAITYLSPLFTMRNMKYTIQNNTYPVFKEICSLVKPVTKFKEWDCSHKRIQQ